MERNSRLGRAFLILSIGALLSGSLLQPNIVAAEPIGTAGGENQSIHLLILLVPAFGFEEAQKWVESMPEAVRSHLQLAGMTMRTGGRLEWYNNLATLVTGKFTEGTPLWNAYQLRGDQIIHPMERVSAAEADGHQLLTSRGRTPWGYLGEALSNHGVVTYALGNSDSQRMLRRMGPALIMNREGEARGQIGPEILRSTPYRPGGWRTDWGKLTHALSKIWQVERRTLTVVELGDLWRIEETYVGHKKTSRLSQLYKEEWLDEWQEWFAQLTAQLGEDGEESVTIWIVSPMISQTAKARGQLLAPFITWRKGQVAGTLSSATTKQNGVVANVDLLPSLLAHYNLPAPTHLYGQEIGLKAGGVWLLESHRWLNRLKELLHGADKEGTTFFTPFFEHMKYLFVIYRTRRTIISLYLSIMIFLLIATASYWWFSKRYWGARIVQILIGTVLVSPIYFLWLTPLIQVIGPYRWIVLLFCAAFVTSFILYHLLSNVWFLTVLGLSNTMVILFDVWRGSLWMKRSFLGYDPLIGARFYGLGNEYAGILLGSSLLAVTGVGVWLNQKGWLSRRSVKAGLASLVSLLYLLIIYSMAAPQLGTNAGATLAALLTYFLSMFLLFRIRMGWRHLVAFSAFILLSLFALLQLHLHGEHTHVSAFIQAIQGGDWTTISEVVIRKVEMNWRLIKVSLWGKLLTTALIVLGLISFRLHRHPHYRDMEDMSLYQMWMTGFRTMIIGALAILVVNDSGVVAAATTIIFLTFPFIFLRFNRHSIREERPEQGLA